MNIIQTCGSDSWGGLEMQTMKIAVALSLRGHRVTMLCVRGSTLHRQALEAGLATVPLLGGPGGKAVAAWRISAWLRRQSCEVIHVHLSSDLWALVPGIYLSRWPGMLLFTKRMGSSLNKKDPLHRLLYRRVDNIYAVSEYVRRNVIDTCPVPPEKVHRLHNGLPLENFRPEVHDRREIRRALGIDPATLVVGIIGRLTPKKGHQEFLEAAEILTRQYPDRLTFLVVGGASHGEEAYEQKIRRRVADNPLLQPRVIFSGFRNDIPRMLAAIDLLAFPSYKEAFGNTLLEAMAMGVPIVASNSGGVPEIIEEGVSGILMPPRDGPALAAGLQKLIEAPELRRRLAQTGREVVARRFRFEDYIDRLEGIYQEGMVNG